MLYPAPLSSASIFVNAFPSLALRRPPTFSARNYIGLNCFNAFIVNGIKSMIGKVGDAVSSVANKIRGFLHFSVPDEGPLTDYEISIIERWNLTQYDAKDSGGEVIRWCRVRKFWADSKTQKVYTDALLANL